MFKCIDNKSSALRILLSKFLPILHSNIKVNILHVFFRKRVSDDSRFVCVLCMLYMLLWFVKSIVPHYFGLNPIKVKAENIIKCSLIVPRRCTFQKRTSRGGFPFDKHDLINLFESWLFSVIQNHRHSSLLLRSVQKIVFLLIRMSRFIINLTMYCFWLLNF